MTADAVPSYVPMPSATMSLIQREIIHIICANEALSNG